MCLFGLNTRFLSPAPSTPRRRWRFFGRHNPLSHICVYVRDPEKCRNVSHTHAHKYITIQQMQINRHFYASRQVCIFNWIICWECGFSPFCAVFSVNRIRRATWRTCLNTKTHIRTCRCEIMWCVCCHYGSEKLCKLKKKKTVSRVWDDTLCLWMRLWCSHGFRYLTHIEHIPVAADRA